jgi:hypothetical protein
MSAPLICPTGKSLPSQNFRHVQPFLQKYSDFQKTQISLYPLLSRPTEGRIAIVTDAGRDAVDAEVPITNGIDADGEVVWSRHPDAGVRSAGSIPLTTVANKPGTPGRARRNPLKPLRGECRVNRCDRGDYARMLFITRIRGCGRIARPAFPAPSVQEAKEFLHNSGAARREIVDPYSPFEN